MAEVDWDLRDSGPREAECTVLLLPGGLCGTASYVDVMSDPVLAGTRMVAATLPGHAGASPLTDASVENNARVAAELARSVGADVLVG